MAKRSDPFTVIVEQDEEGYFVASVPEEQFGDAAS